MTDAGADVLAVADRHEAKLAKAIVRTFEFVRNQFPVDVVAKLIDTGEWSTIPQRIPWDDIFTMPTVSKAEPSSAFEGDALTREFLQTMVQAAKTIGIDEASFTLTNPNAVKAARAMSADLISDQSKRAQASVKRTILRAIRGNLTAQDAATLISRSIGLDARSAAALANYTAQLAQVQAGTAPRSVLRRAGFNYPRAAQGRSTAVARYSKRLLNVNAETIARTEIMRAANRGITLGWEEAANAGLIDTNHARRQWVVTYDDRTCEYCVPMDGAVVPFYDPFVSDTKGLTFETLEPAAKTTLNEPPLHPRCRCTLILLA